METEKLRINSGVKAIEVNNSGEYIYIPVNDSAFFKRVSNFYDWVIKKQAEFEAEFKNKAETDISISDAISMQLKLSNDICAELDKLFGEGCCRKVFKDVQSPDIILIWEFLEQLMPILQKYAMERNERINFKYNKNRRGTKGKR